MRETIRRRSLISHKPVAQVHNKRIMKHMEIATVGLLFLLYRIDRPNTVNYSHGRVETQDGHIRLHNIITNLLRYLRHQLLRRVLENILRITTPLPGRIQ